MNIELGLFVSVILASGLICFLILAFREQRHFLGAKKDFALRKRICQICFFISFTYRATKYWRCSLCGGINKEDDYRDRNSSR